MYKLAAFTIAAIVATLFLANAEAATAPFYNITPMTNYQSMGKSVQPFSQSNLATIDAEHFVNGSPAVGQTIHSMSVAVVKCGSANFNNLNGNLVIAAFDSSGNTKSQFGTYPVSNINNKCAIQNVNVTLSTPYTIQAGDFIGVKDSQPNPHETAFVYTLTGPNTFDGISSAAFYNGTWNLDANSTSGNFTSNGDLAMTLQ